MGELGEVIERLLKPFAASLFSELLGPYIGQYGWQWVVAVLCAMMAVLFVAGQVLKLLILWLRRSWSRRSRLLTKEDRFTLKVGFLWFAILVVMGFIVMLVKELFHIDLFYELGLATAGYLSLVLLGRIMGRSGDDSR